MAKAAKQKKSVLIYRMPLLLVLVHASGAFFGIITLIMIFSLVTIYLVLSLIRDSEKDGFYLAGAASVSLGLGYSLWLLAKRFIQKQKIVEGLIEKKEKVSYDEGTGFYIVLTPGSVKKEINETAFHKLKQGDRVCLRYLKTVENPVSIRKIIAH